MTATHVDVTLTYALDQMVAGLAAFVAAGPVRTRNCGARPNNSVKANDAMADARFRHAVAVLAELTAAGEAGRLAVARREANFFANLDTFGTFLGGWHHVASSIGYGVSYVLIDGVLGS